MRTVSNDWLSGMPSPSLQALQEGTQNSMTYSQNTPLQHYQLIQHNYLTTLFYYYSKTTLYTVLLVNVTEPCYILSPPTTLHTSIQQASTQQTSTQQTSIQQTSTQQTSTQQASIQQTSKSTWTILPDSQ